MTADRPLEGVRVVVTRAKAQASVLNAKLEALGAEAIGVAMIEIVPPADGGAALRSALASGNHTMIVVSSPNGARILADTAADMIASDEVHAPLLPLVACVGPSTAAVLHDSLLEVAVVPDRSVAEGLLDEMPTPPRPHDRLLLVQAEVARDVLETGLAELGWQVDRITAYRTVDAQVSDRDRARAASGDIVTFTSSSTVDRFVRLLGRDSLPAAIASIGPITSATARNHGLRVDVEADPHTIDGLVQAVLAWEMDRRLS